MAPTSKTSTAAVLALIVTVFAARLEGAPHSPDSEPTLGLGLEAPTNEEGTPAVDRLNDYDDAYYVDVNDSGSRYRDPCSFRDICETLISVDDKKNHRVQDSNFVISSNPPKVQATKTSDLYKFSIDDLIVDCNDMLIKCAWQGSRKVSTGDNNAEREAETE
ncbi:uncharacterized protein LOC135220495 [Macrobrachium nipponense]|uniref:uncharacterized protein LOC135220495 n=1 Tax=Macrobrachium nipponense TaxID=159736 RepID=UPI0030C86833